VPQISVELEKLPKIFARAGLNEGCAGGTVFAPVPAKAIAIKVSEGEEVSVASWLGEIRYGASFLFRGDLRLSLLPLPVINIA